VTPAWPPREVFADLAAKYAEIERLRAERASGAPVAPRAVLKRLAARFPGSLRELDTLPEAEIAEKRALLERAAAGGTVEPWMVWLAAYHRLFRIALGAIPTDRGDGPPFTDEMIVRLRNPPRGRRTDVVIHVIAETFGAQPTEVGEALLPRRRRRSPPQ
jgi:hypothetical protein